MLHRNKTIECSSWSTTTSIERSDRSLMNTLSSTFVFSLTLLLRPTVCEEINLLVSDIPKTQIWLPSNLVLGISRTYKAFTWFQCFMTTFKNERFSCFSPELSTLKCSLLIIVKEHSSSRQFYSWKYPSFNAIRYFQHLVPRSMNVNRLIVSLTSLLILLHTCGSRRFTPLYCWATQNPMLKCFLDWILRSK